MSKPQRTAIDQIEFVRNLLAFMLVSAFVIAIGLFVFKAIPQGNSDIVTYMVGQLSGMALTALGFYFVNKVGQDAIDAKRVDNTSKALDAITETAKVAGGSVAPDIELQPGETATVAAEPEGKTDD